ncbi:MAG: PDDEXK nuclease domain-containing protein [Candidatus Moraniibacteriota bacterium]
MKKTKKTQLSNTHNYKDLISSISDILAQGRKLAHQAVNAILTTTYWQIGRQIVEFEQGGKERAEYGTQFLQKLSHDLTKQFGEGFSYRNIRLIRQFYVAFPIWHTVSANSKKLSWSHYVRLMSIENADERSFYEIECEKNSWSVRELCRQFDTSLYERLALSRDKKGIRALAEKGQIIEKTEDLFKEPYVLEFLGLDESYHHSENDLESAIIDKMEHFLLELGKGFAFVSRQKRITSGVKHFYIDLVFYNRLLKCFVLIDLKIGELKHQDLGQMQMYVNYFDRDVKEKEENPTIGIVLCKENDHFVVEYTLPKDNNQIFAKKYQLYLPKKEELLEQVKRML